MFRLPSKPGTTSRIEEAVRWPKRLAVLTEGHDGFVHDLPGERNAPRDSGAITAFRQHPCGPRIRARPGSIRKRSGHAGPFIGADQGRGCAER